MGKEIMGGTNSSTQTLTNKTIDANNNTLENVVTSKNITNCITEVPQDINLVFENNALVLKAGSKVYIPNGFETDGTTPKFDEVILENDITNTDFGTSTSDPDMWFYPLGHNSLSGWPQSICFSGPDKSVIPDTTTWAVFYDTALNKIFYRAGSTTWNYGAYSLPVALAYNETNHTNDRILSVFNGSGFIGSTIYVLPGVKGFSPNGFNEDGTTKNIEVSTSKIVLDTISPNAGLNNHKGLYAIRANGASDPYIDNQFVYSTPSSTYTGYYFNKIYNKWYWYTSGALGGQIFPVVVSTYNISSTASNVSISNFNPPKVFQAENIESFTRDYSLQETFTGKYWIDGKPIYKRTFIQNTGTLTVNTTSSLYIDTSFTNNVWEKVIDFKCFLGGGLQLPFYYVAPSTISGSNTTSTLIAMWCDFTSSGARFVYYMFNSTYASSYSNLNIFLTAYYTKIID